MVNVDACKPVGEGAEAPSAKGGEPVTVRHGRDSYQGVRCTRVLTGCRAGPGCPHYCGHCKGHIAYVQRAV